MSFTGVTEIKRKLVGKIHLLKVIPGFSAYELAVKHGFKGTEEEWLASLSVKGDPGTLESHTEVDALGHRVINVADPEADTDAVNKRYVGEDISEEFITEYSGEYDAFEVSAYKRGNIITVNLYAKVKSTYTEKMCQFVINEKYWMRHLNYITVQANIAKSDADKIAAYGTEDFISVDWTLERNPEFTLSFSYFCK